MLQLSHCYKLLHLEEDCSDLELRQRYRKIALELHPDKLKYDDSQSQKDTHEFIRLSQAYKRIASYRRQRKPTKKEKDSESSFSSKNNSKWTSFQQIKKKIVDLNKIIDQSTTQNNHCSSFTSQIDTLYDQHLKIMQNMSEKLRLMRGK